MLKWKYDKEFNFSRLFTIVGLSFSLIQLLFRRGLIYVNQFSQEIFLYSFYSKNIG